MLAPGWPRLWSAGAGAVLTFFGFMHGSAVGIAVSPTLAVTYAIVAVVLFAVSRYPALAPALTAPSGEVMAAAPASEGPRKTIGPISSRPERRSRSGC
jgi:hypothetical protein